MDIKKEYERWLENATADADVAAELKTLDDTKIEDAFYRDLAFGTGGLRGVIGAGTNRMNIYTVAKASQGLADYLKKNFAEPSVAIGYDSRIKSDVFAKVAAGVFAANGVKVNIWTVLMPVPTVSFATRYLHTSAGVMVTASHNPSKYNGYKVYGADGCQITTEAAAEILAEIEKLDIFADVKHSNFEAGLANGSIKYIPDEVCTAFVNEVKNQSVLFGEEVNKKCCHRLQSSERYRSEACDPYPERDGLHQYYGGQGAGAAGWQFPDLPVPEPGDQGSNGTGYGICQEVQR